MIKIAFKNQSDIDWNNILCGGVSHLWFQAHDSYCEDRGLLVSMSSVAFGPQLMNHLITFAMSIWNYRNTFYYGKDFQESQEFASRNINSKIKTLYQDH